MRRKSACRQRTDAVSVHCSQPVQWGRPHTKWKELGRVLIPVVHRRRRRRSTIWRRRDAHTDFDHGHTTETTEGWRRRCRNFSAVVVAVYCVIDRVESCRQVQQGQGSKVATVDCLQNIRQHVQYGGLSRMTRSKSKLEWRKKVGGTSGRRAVGGQTRDVPEASTVTGQIGNWSVYELTSEASNPGFLNYWSYETPFLKTEGKCQSCPWVGSIHGLGWVGLGRVGSRFFNLRWVGLGWVAWRRK